MTDDQELFDDEPETATTEATSFDKAEEQPEDDAQAEAEGAAEEGSDKEGDDTAEPPAATEGEKTDTQSEKMIPEHRFKAALKDATDKLTKAEQELAQLKATPVPDRAADPDGYDRHIRIETSKAVMRETHTDYDEKIIHFQEMAKANPTLNQIVGDAAIPAKMAYDLATKDLEIRDLSNLKNSDEWKQFQEWKKSGGAAAAQPTDAAQGKQKPLDLASKVPNLNRSTSVSRAKTMSSQDDELFAGAL